MKIGTKLYFAFSIIVLAIIVNSVLVNLSLNKIERKQEEALETRLEQIRIVDDIRVDLAMQGLHSRALVIDNNEKSKENLLKYSSNLDNNLSELKKFQEQSDNKDMEKFLNDAIDKKSQFNDSMEVFFSKLDNKEESFEFLKTNLSPLNLEMEYISYDMIEIQEKELEIIKEETNSSVNSAKNTSIICVILSIIISIFIVYLINKTVIRPLNKLMVEAESISKGDLTHSKLEIKSKDEIGDLARIFNEMKLNLISLISSIKNNTETVISTSEKLLKNSEQVASDNKDISSISNNSANNAKESAVSAKESSIAMDETAHGIGTIAESTQNLQKISLDTEETVLKGNKNVYDSKEQVEKINENTFKVSNLVSNLSIKIDKIEEITKVITDITAQTNLLALNAAIEAARAGEHGKGFAVVADEVKKLADNSKQSADSIISLINEIQKETDDVSKAVSDSLTSVDKGVEIISNTNNSFDDIKNSILQLNSQIQEVSATTEELSSSSEQVSASVNQLSEASEFGYNNIVKISELIDGQSKSLDDINNISKELINESLKLKEEINKFKI